MEFKKLIEKLEYDNFDETYIFRLGNVPVMLTAVHTMEQIKPNGDLKYSEPFTKAIARYVSEKTDCFSFIKLKDTMVDSNSLILDDFKVNLLNYIKEKNIKLLIDLHGAAITRDFDVEFGTLNNLSADFSTIRELEDAFNEKGIKNIKYNDPFKGGGITQYIYFNTNIDIIQIEINQKFRKLDNCEEIKKICDSLISFVNQYSEYLNR